MKLPSGKIVYSSTSIYPTSNFTWGEVTKGCTRPIEDLVIDRKLVKTALEIEKTIIYTAKKLDSIRRLLGNRPIHINSWYRPSTINRRVGGAKYSRHLYGDGVDIRSDYLSPKQIHSKLKSIHIEGGLGLYFSFIHLDFRGYKARWGKA